MLIWEAPARRMSISSWKADEVQQAAAISEGQNPAMVLAIAEKVRGILSSAEPLESTCSGQKVGGRVSDWPI